MGSPGVRLHLILYKTAYLPGERVVCSVQLYNKAGDDGRGGAHADVKQLVVTSVGHERTDTYWVRRLHRPDVPPEPSEEPRKNVRSIYRTLPVALLQDTRVPPGTCHQFLARFRLPDVLPPTFKGQACRFTYQLHVRALYTQQPEGTPTPIMYETAASTLLIVLPPSASAAHPLLTNPGNHLLTRHSPSQQLPPPPSKQPQQQQQQQGRFTQPPSELPSQPSSPASCTGNGGDAGGAGLPPRPSGTSSDSQSQYGAAPQQQQQTLYPPADIGRLVRPPLIDYLLLQQVKIKVKEVPVDYALLHRHGGEGMQGASHVDSSQLPGSPTHPSTTAVTPLASPSVKSLTDVVAATPSNGPSPRGSKSQNLHQQQQHAANAQHYHLLSSPHHAATNGGAQHGSVAPQLASPAHHPHHHVQQQRALAVGSPVLGSDSSSSDESGAFGEQGPAAAAWRRRRNSRAVLAGIRSLAAPLPSPAGLAAGAGQQAMFGHTYTLKLREHIIMRVTLQAPLDAVGLQPGCTFGGLVELRPGGLASPPAMLCHQLNVLLESEEVVPAEYSTRGAGKQPGVMRRLLCEHQELTSDMAVAQFLFSVPTGATPSFETPVVALRWVLRFELMVGPPFPVLGLKDNAAPDKRAPLEVLSWSLPLFVHA